MRARAIPSRLWPHVRSVMQVLSMSRRVYFHCQAPECCRNIGCDSLNCAHEHLQPVASNSSHYIVTCSMEKHVFILLLVLYRKNKLASELMI